MIELSNEKEPNFAVDLVKSYGFKNRTRVVADNGLWLTHPSHLEWVLYCQKRTKHKVQTLEL